MGDIDKEGETNTARHPSNLHSTIGAPTKSPDAVKFHIQPPEKPYTRSDFQLEDRHIDRGRPLRVAVIGAGLSGVLAGAILPPKVPGIKLVIFEKNTDVGGTWLENVYPGVRCDIPAHVYQSTFDPNIEWSEEFAQGAEIQSYWKNVARKHDVYRHIRFRHRVDNLEWIQSTSQWKVSVRDLSKDIPVIESFDFVITAIGRFNAWKLPSYPGMSDYKGLLRHASNWDPKFDPKGKRVAVIGNGASGIQLVANIQPQVTRLDHYARNPTWIATSFGGDDTSIEPKIIPEELKKSFEDPQVYLAYRKSMEEKYWRRFHDYLKGSQKNEKARDEFLELLKQRTLKKPSLFHSLVPDFSPHCRRLTPGPGYLEAVAEDNVDYIQTKIKRFTTSGIETEDGVCRPVDAVFCATGANTDMVPPFPIRAFGQDLTTLWHPKGAYGFPYTYLGIATPGFPNLLFLLGPHGSGRSGTVPHSTEIQLALFAKILRKMSREGIKAMAPSQGAANDFVDYADSFFNTTVLSENCSSWYNGGKPGGRIHGLWPGSATHMTTVHREPRWEDWEYEYISTSNRFAWYFGNGYTRKEGDPESDMTPYLKRPDNTDLKDLHESWWSIP